MKKPELTGKTGPMRRPALNRREMLERCIHYGGLLLAAPMTVTQAAAALTAPLQPTPAAVLGPAYRRLAPERALLRQAGDSGLPLQIAGRLFSQDGSALHDAVIEYWQADGAGEYDMEGDRYRTTLKPGARARYTIDTMMPTHYPGRVCQHSHYLVRAPGHKPLITQLYFATDPVFEGDPDRNYGRDPLITSRELVRPVRLVPEPGSVAAQVEFDLVLEKL